MLNTGEAPNLEGRVIKKALLFSIAVCVSLLTAGTYAAVSGDYEYTDNGDGT